MENKVGRPRFFQKNFLVANIKFKMILEIFFFKINNTNMLFEKKILIWKTYTTNKTLFIIEQIQNVNSKKFILAAFYIDNKTFIVHVTIQE